MKDLEPIKLVDAALANFSPSCVGCIVLTQDNKILLQHRPADWWTFPDCLATFGGHIDDNEMPMQALVRELNEELGAKADPAEIVSLGVITEAITKYSESICVYFWHDKHGTITGCNECEARTYASCTEALAEPKLMDDVRWLLTECQKRNLLPDVIAEIPKIK